MSSVFQRVAALALNAPSRCLRALTRLELVTGPPGSGKSTWVRERMLAGEAVVDLDTLADAFAGTHAKAAAMMPVVWAARDAAVYALASEVALPRAWVVACAPTRRERKQAAEPFAQARLTVLEVGVAECLRRIELQRRAGETDWRTLVEAWWREYRRPGKEEGWLDVEVIGC